MSTFNIPEIGSKWQLTASWSFPLYWERRNESLFKKLLGYRVVLPHYRREQNDIGLAATTSKTPYCLWSDSCLSDPDSKQMQDAALALFESVSRKSKLNLRLNRRGAVLDATIPKGALLTVDRIYIRQGAKEFSSVSFYVSHKSISGHPRFWAKLSDVNRAKVTPAGETKETRDQPKKGQLVRGVAQRTIGLHHPEKYCPVRVQAEPSNGDEVAQLVRSRLDNSVRISKTFQYSSHTHRKHLSTQDPPKTTA